MAKKGSKKKAKNAKKAGKAKKTAQRKPARKTSRKTARKTTPTAASPTIKYRCIGGAGGNCTATPKSAHMGPPGATVTLEAVNTDVTITFGAKGSPFQPPTNPLSITAGTTLSQVVDPGAAGTFTYVLSCSECSRQSMGPPEMIVP